MKDDLTKQMYIILIDKTNKLINNRGKHIYIVLTENQKKTRRLPRWEEGRCG